MEDRKIIMAYIAGLYDGDGSFSLSKSFDKNEKHSPNYYPLIQFCNRERKTLELIKNYFGGYIHERQPYVKNGCTRQTSYTLKIKGSIASKPFLETIIPFLIIKQDQAKLLLNFIEKNPFKRSSVKLSDDINNLRELDYKKMKLMNDKRDDKYNISIKRTRKNSNDECFWAYLSGLLDTDGSFSVKKIHSEECVNYLYSSSILLSMVDSRGIQFIRDNCEFGKIMMIKSKAATQGFCYRFNLYNKNEIIQVIKKCLPYLTIKKAAALILLEFCEKFEPTLGRRKITKEQVDFREDCYQRLIKTNANKDGVYKSSLIVLKTLPGDAGGNKEQAGGSTVQLERSKREDADNKGDAVL